MSPLRDDALTVARAAIAASLAYLISQFVWGHEFPFFSSIVAFIIMAAVVYFGVIKPYQAMRERFVAAEEETTDESVELLREIRDSLRAGRA